MTVERQAFPRDIESLSAMVEFTAQVFAAQGIAADRRLAVDLVLEELFTNIAKYGAGTSPVWIEIDAAPGGVVVCVTEFDADYFDLTRAPAIDVSQPADEREPGGLGLHLIRRLVDSIDYRYSKADRCSRITFRKAWPAPSAESPPAGEERQDAVD